MKKISFLLFILFLSVLFSACKNEDIVEDDIMDTALKELEIATRARQDPRAVFSYTKYERLLSVFDNEKFIVLPMNEFKDSINDDKVLIGFRHDIDCHPFKALEMAKMENAHGFRASYYILASAPYYGEFINGQMVRNSCMESIYKKIQSYNHEIGIHNDLISLMILYDIDPFRFNQEELLFYRNLNIVVNGTVAHGSYLTSQTVDNYQIFSDFAESSSFEFEGKTYEIGKYSLKEFGFDYEAYFVDFDHYYSDTLKTWTEESEFENFLNTLRNSKPGTKIQILTHPVWWGK